MYKNPFMMYLRNLSKIIKQWILRTSFELTEISYHIFFVKQKEHKLLLSYQQLQVLTFLLNNLKNIPLSLTFLNVYSQKVENRFRHSDLLLNTF